MMCIPTETQFSTIHGLGVFLLQPVKKGDLIWRFDTRIDRIYTASEIASLPEHARSFLETYCCWDEQSGTWAYFGDNGRYMNHASNPNTKALSAAFGDGIALSDLDIGTELTCDYHAICDVTRKTGVL